MERPALLLAVFVAGVLVGAVVAHVNTSAHVVNDVCTEALRMIEGAEERIYLAMYNLYYYDEYPTSCSNRIVHALADARKRGVHVVVVVDAKEENERAARLLEANGVTVVRYEGDGLMHAKVLAVDGCVLAGSSNYTFSGLFKNVEFNVKVCGLEITEWFEGVLARAGI